MSRQFNFFCSVEEMNSLLPIIAEYGAAIIGMHRFSNEPVICSDFSPESKLRGKCIVLRRCLNEIVWVRLDESEHYVNTSVSPIIEASIYPPANGKWHRARLYMLNGYDGRNGWVAYPNDLVKLYQSLVSRLKRKVLTKQDRFGMRCSPEVLKFEVAGGEVSRL